MRGTEMEKEVEIYATNITNKTKFTAMGSSLSPIVSNNLMKHFEKLALGSAQHN
jgi:hypothetical protein